MKQNHIEKPVSIVIATGDLDAFGFILQQGIGVGIRPGCSLKDLLCEQFNIRPAYMDTRIKTAFLDGKPVDDYASAVVRDNAVLALSAAMPGLVGATFRSGGILSPFRSGISFRNTAETAGSEQHGKITVKLFNLLVKEIGPVFLENGVWVRTRMLKELLTERSGVTGFKEILMNGQRATPENITALPDSDGREEILLTVRAE